MKRSPENMERQRATRAEKISRGEPVGRLQFGYRAVRGVGHVAGVEPDEHMLELIKEARKMREEGRSLRTILRVLGPKGLVNRHGWKLSPSTLMRVLGRTES